MIGIGMTERARLQIEAQARAWQVKVQDGQLATEQMEEFGQWMSVPANAAAFADCEFTQADIQALDRKADPQWQGWKGEAEQRAQDGGPKVEPLANWSDLVFSPNARSRQSEESSFWKPAFAVAASVALVAFGFSWQLTSRTNVLHYQAVDTTREVLLPDGTRLTLDAGTAVDYVKEGDTRRLMLPAGRVYLNVSKDPNHARFVVQSGEVETVVLGTRFVVSQTPERTEVVLEEGKVRMQRTGSAQYTNLMPGQKGWWRADATGFHTATASPSAALAWTRGRLLFENASLADAVQEVNRYSKQVQIEIADPDVANLRVNGSYLAGDAELVVAAWEATLPVKASHEGNRIRIRRH